MTATKNLQSKCQFSQDPGMLNLLAVSQEIQHPMGVSKWICIMAIRPRPVRKSASICESDFRIPNFFRIGTEFSDFSTLPACSHLALYADPWGYDCGKKGMQLPFCF